MRHFFGSYGFTIFASLIASTLLITVSPLSKQFGDGIEGNVDTFSIAAHTSIEEVGVPSTLGYKPKDVVEIGGKNYVILQDRGSNRYLVMDINGIWKKKFNHDNNGQDPNKCALVNGSLQFETCNNSYSGSDIDEYLNSEYYESLPVSVKSSIVENNIKQSYYKHQWSNPYYKSVAKGDLSYDGCNNTVCVLNPDGKWVRWDEHVAEKGKPGAFNYKLHGDTDNFGNRTTGVKRKVFLPSIAEISSIINLSDQWEMDKFLTDEHGNKINMWLRDSRNSMMSEAMIASKFARSISSYNLIYNDINVRPSFVIDLEAYFASLEA